MISNGNYVCWDTEHLQILGQYLTVQQRGSQNSIFGSQNESQNSRSGSHKKNQRKPWLAHIATNRNVAWLSCLGYIPSWSYKQSFTRPTGTGYIHSAESVWLDRNYLHFVSGQTSVNARMYVFGVELQSFNLQKACIIQHVYAACRVLVNKWGYMSGPVLCSSCHQAIQETWVNPH